MHKGNQGRRTKLLLFFVVAAILIAACRKNIPQPYVSQSGGYTSMSQIFEDFWNGMNTHYVFWDIDTVNWDRVYYVFKDSFALLKPPYSHQDSLVAQRYFTEMTQNLIDGHYEITFANSNLPLISPAATRKKILPAVRLTFLYDTVANKYLDNSRVKADYPFTSNVTGPTVQYRLQMISGTIEHKIVYLRFNHFHLKQYLDSNKYLKQGWQFFLSNVRDPQTNSLGIIIDLRSNNGGNIEDLDFIAGELTDHDYSFAFTKEKNGDGRLDYSPWVNATVRKSSDGQRFSKNLVILIDQHSVSMAEMLPMAIRTLPNTWVIGDTTWGANGPLSSSNAVYGGGMFHFGGNFGFVYTSSAQYMYSNGKIFEGKGFPPDQPLHFDTAAEARGRDNQLEAAIDYLKTH